MVYAAGEVCCGHRRSSGSTFKLLLAHFVPKLQNDALRDLFSDAGRLCEHFLVAGDDRERKPVGRRDRKNGKRCLGTDAGNTDHHLKAGLFLLVDKAVQLENPLAHIEIGQQAGLRADFQPADCILRSMAGITHTAAVDYGKSRLKDAYRSVNIIKHKL